MSADAALSAIGLARASEEFRTSSHRLAQFARAVDDTNPRHLAGEFAAPVFAHIPVMQSMVEVLEQVADGFALHGEQDFIYHAPIRPGLRLFTTSTLTGVRGTRAGLTFIIRSDTATHERQPVATQYSTLLVRSPATTDAAGEFPPARSTPAKTGGRTEHYTLAVDQTRRYADAARDYSPYTIDPAAAAKEGYPAPIVHGMCTLAFIARAIVDRHCGGNTPRLKRLACRFAHPLFLTPGQALAVEHWAGPDGIAGFEARDRDGNLVVKNGYAEISA